MAYSDRIVYRVLVDGTRPFRAQGYPYKRQDMTSVRQDYTHAVVWRRRSDHDEARVYSYASSLERAEKLAGQKSRKAHRAAVEQGKDGPDSEYLVVPLAWRWAADKRSHSYGYRWEEAAPGGLKGYTSPPPEEEWVIEARSGQRYRLFDTRRSTPGPHAATEISPPGGTPRRPDVEAMNEREGWCRFAAIPFVVDPDEEANDG
jgi:hypothetical protein